MMRAIVKRYCCSPHPSAPATFAGTVQDLCGALAIVAVIVAAMLWAEGLV